MERTSLLAFPALCEVGSGNPPVQRMAYHRFTISALRYKHSQACSF